jgi:hypothetical protein
LRGLLFQRGELVRFLLQILRLLELSPLEDLENRVQLLEGLVLPPEGFDEVGSPEKRRDLLQGLAQVRAMDAVGRRAHAGGVIGVGGLKLVRKLPDAEAHVLKPRPDLLLLLGELRGRLGPFLRPPGDAVAAGEREPQGNFSVAS